MIVNNPELIWSLLAYFAVILMLAKTCSRRMTSLSDFFLADRRLGALPIALTFAASWFGAGSTIASLNLIHQQGLSGLWELAIPSVLSCTVITLFMARRVTRFKTLSMPEAVEHHYGRTGRLLLAVTILLAVTAFLGSQLVAAGKLYEALLGWDLTLTTCLITGVIVAYSMLGGYFAVVVTDMAQMVLILLSLGLLLVFCLGQFTGPVGDLSGFLHTVALHRDGGAFWGLGKNLPHHLALTTAFVLAWSIAPEMWQRMSSTEHEGVAVRASAGATALLILCFILILGIGLMSVAVLSSTASSSPVGPSEQVFVDLTLLMKNPWLQALALVGVTSAISSTMDSSINVGSLTLARDIYQGFLRKQASTAEMLRISQIGTLVVALPAIVLALSFQDIIRVLWISADIYASVMFVPIIGMLYLKNPGRLSGVLAMLCGGLGLTVSALQQYGLVQWPFPWPQWPYSTLIGVGLSVLGFAAGYAMTRSTTIRQRAALPGFLSGRILDGLRAQDL